jgi:hypothetical protein
MKAARCIFFREWLGSFYGISWYKNGIKMVETWYKNGITLWKITIFNGKIHYKSPFSIAILTYITRG